MRLQRHLTGNAVLAGSAVAIGNFDGVHRGHQDLFARLVATAKDAKLGSAAVIFEPQPLEFLHPEKAPPRIMRLRGKLEMLRQIGVQHVLCLRFNSQLAHMDAANFIKDVLHRELACKMVYVGADFRFGHKRAGNVQLLRQHGDACGFTVYEAPKLMHDDARISSTRIRLALANGDFSLAQELLGHNISIRGRVVSGEARGRGLGAPTINMEPLHCPPISGIFSSILHVNGNSHPGTSYLGLRPQYGDRESPILESNLFAAPADNLHGEWARVELLGMLRSDRSFANESDLARQMQQDIADSRNWHREHGS